MKEKICPFSEVRVSIPRARLIKLFYEHTALDPYEVAEMRGLSEKLNKAAAHIAHAQSLVAVVLNRA